MKIISFIAKSRKDLVRRILEHPGLWEDDETSLPRNRPPPKPPPEKTITYEPLDDGQLAIKSLL